MRADKQRPQNAALTFPPPQIGRLLHELVQARHVDASTRVITSVDWPYMAWEQINPPQVAVAAQEVREKSDDNPLPQLSMRVGDVVNRAFASDFEARPGYWMGKSSRLRDDQIGEYQLNKVRPRPQTVRYRAFELDDDGFHFNN